MRPYDDMLARAAASAPWEARSINGPHHDTADWLGSGAGFPLPVERMAGIPERPLGRHSGKPASKGSWGYFELSGSQTGWSGGHEANPWTLDATAGPASSFQQSAFSLIRRLSEEAHDQRTSPESGEKHLVRHAPAPSESAASRAGLSALAALRDLAEARREGASAAQTRAPAASEGLSALRALRDAARAARPAPEGSPKPTADEGAAPEATASRSPRFPNAPAHSGNGCPEPHVAPSPNTVPSGGGLNIAAAAAPLPEARRAGDRKQPPMEQRVSVVSVNDPFAAHLLRACLLASSFAKRPLAGLDEIIPARDLAECASTVYLSHTLCPGDGWSADPGADAAAEVEAVASTSLAAFDGALAPANPQTAPGARIERAFALLDFTGSSWLGSTMPVAFAEALRAGRCVIVLAESARADIWSQLLSAIREARAADGAVEEVADRTLNLFTVGEGALRSVSGRSRFLHAWWAWFGSGSHWGFRELGSALERALGVLGFNLRRQSYDLGLVSLIAALLRDGGTIASADDVAEALFDRFPDRDLLQLSVDAVMDTLLHERPRTENDRVFILSDTLFRTMDEQAKRPASLEAIAALRSSPSLQALLRPDGAWVEVRFSSLFACLAARWFLNDPSRTALQVADRLEALASRVPSGGWGRIVLQTALLAEQRGQSYAGRVILDRLHAQTDDWDRRSMLVEISLGLFLDTGGALPRIWRNGFFSGSVDRMQAHALAEAREGSWLRDESLLALRHATDALRARVRAGALRDDDPPQAAGVCAWMDTLLHATQASCARELFDQVSSDLTSGDPLERRSALGRYDCLVWACLFGVHLPCRSWRADALREGPLHAVAHAAADELASEGAAYAECARFAWFYATECPSLWSEETWRRVGETAARIALDTACAADDGRRDSAHEVLAAYALRMGAGGAAALPPLPALASSDIDAPSDRTACEGARLPQDHEAKGPGKRLRIAMAQAALGICTPEEARALVCATINPDDLGAIATYQFKLFLAASNIDDGEDRQETVWPSARTQRHSCTPEELCDLSRRWKACLARLGLTE